MSVASCVYGLLNALLVNCRRNWASPFLAAAQCGLILLNLQTKYVSNKLTAAEYIEMRGSVPQATLPPFPFYRALEAASDKY